MHDLPLHCPSRSPPPHPPHRPAAVRLKTAREHRIDWKPAEELEDGGGNGTTGSEHHRGANQNCICERGPNRQFAFATFTDIKRRRAGVGADSGNVRQPLQPGWPCLIC